MKTLSVKTYTAALLDFFAGNRSLSAAISKWIVLNTAAAMKRDDALAKTMHN